MSWNHQRQQPVMIDRYGECSSSSVQHEPDERPPVPAQHHAHQQHHAAAHPQHYAATDVPVEAANARTQRVENFKSMLAARRAAALEALGSEPDEEEASEVFSRGTSEEAAASRRQSGPTAEARRKSRQNVFDRLAQPGGARRGFGHEMDAAEEKELTFQPEVSKRAQKTRSREDVFDRLWNKSKNAEKLRKDKKREKEECERSAQTAQPKVNRSHRSRSEEGSFVERMQRCTEEKNEHLEQARHQAAKAREAEEEELRNWTLDIRPYSKQLHRPAGGVFSSLHAWQDEKDKRLEDLQQQKAQEAKRMADPKHYMSDGTRRLIAQFDRSMPVHDMLIAQGELSNQRQKYLRHLKEQEEKISVEMGPSITEAAESLDRDGDICERLYDMALEKKASDDAMERRGSHHLFDQKTGRRFFEPAINPKSWQVMTQL